MVFQPLSSESPGMHVINADSWAPPRPSDSKSWDMNPRNLDFNSHIHLSLRTSAPYYNSRLVFPPLHDMGPELISVPELILNSYPDH